MVVVSSCREVSAYAITSATLIDSYHQVDAGDSVETAVVRCEEGGDDVKSARPLRPGLHTFTMGVQKAATRRRDANPESPLSSD